MFYTITAVNDGQHIVEVIEAATVGDAEDELITRIVDNEKQDSGIDLARDDVAPWIISCVVTTEKPKLVYCD